MPIVSSGSAGSQLRRIRIDVDTRPLVVIAALIADLDENPHMTTRLSRAMPRRSPASLDIRNSVPPTISSGSTAATRNQTAAPDPDTSSTESPARAPRRLADSEPITSASGARCFETSRPSVRPITSAGRTVVPIGYANPAGGACTTPLPRYSPRIPTLADRPKPTEAPALRAAFIARWATSARSSPEL